MDGCCATPGRARPVERAYQIQADVLVSHMGAITCGFLSRSAFIADVKTLNLRVCVSWLLNVQSIILAGLMHTWIGLGASLW